MSKLTGHSLQIQQTNVTFGINICQWTFYLRIISKMLCWMNVNFPLMRSIYLLAFITALSSLHQSDSQIKNKQSSWHCWLGIFRYFPHILHNSILFFYVHCKEFHVMMQCKRMKRCSSMVWKPILNSDVFRKYKMFKVKYTWRHKNAATLWRIKSCIRWVNTITSLWAVRSLQSWLPGSETINQPTH